jgi:hypothetical protein
MKNNANLMLLLIISQTINIFIICNSDFKEWSLKDKISRSFMLFLPGLIMLSLIFNPL